MILINANNKMNDVEKCHLDSLENKINTKLKLLINKKGLRYKNVYRYLLDNLEVILIGKPSELEKITAHFKQNLKIQFDARNKKSVLYKCLKDIFDYSAFVRSYPPANWGAYQLVMKLNVKICPYCNRQYIFTICNDTGKTRGRLDHFYDKSTYPYLALSLYNLIPCCNTCNTDFKGSSEFSIKTHLNPYVDEFGEYFKFSVQMISGKDLKPGDSNQINYLKGIGDEFEIVIKDSSIDDNLRMKINNNLKIFKIRELYNMHKDYVIDLIKKRVMYSDSQIDELYSLYKGSLFSSREDVVSNIVSNYISYSHLDKRVLAKLTSDISEELNLNIK